MKFRNLLILMVAAVLIIGCSSKPEPDTLLRLGNKNYSLLDFFETNQKESFIKIPESSKIERIETWAEGELLTFAAKKEKFDVNNKNVAKELDQMKNQNIVRYYLDKTILDSIITEQLMNDTYQNMGKEVNASHILIQYRDVNPKVDRTQTEALALAQDILGRVKNGENFATLAKEFSDDKGSGEDGNLGYFGWGKMVDPFQRAAFSMNINEVSDIVETQFGYHIIKVNNMKKVPVGSFAEEKEKIKNSLISMKRSDLQAAYNKRVQTLKDVYGYKINQAAVDTVIAKVAEAKKADGASMKPELEYLRNLKFSDAIAESNGKKITVKDLVGEIDKYTLRLPPEYINTRYFVMVIDNFYVTKLFLMDFENKNIALDEEFQKNIESQKEKVVIKEFRNKLFNSDLDVTEKEVKQYYEENKSTKYMTARKSEVREIYLEDEDEANKLLKDVIAQPDKFDSFSEKLTERYNKKDKPGYLGKISDSQYGTIGRAADTTAANTINPSLIKAGKGWSIIKVYDKVEPEVKELKEVESTIRRILKDKKVQDNRQKVMEDLKKKYKFKIYWECLNIEK